LTNIVLYELSGNLFNFSLLPVIPLKHYLLTAIIGSITSIFGDLLESFLKRAADEKDSGIIFPGHGGILDRVSRF